MESFYDIFLKYFGLLGLTPPDVFLTIIIFISIILGVSDYRIGLMSALLMLVGTAGFYIFLGWETLNVFLLIFSVIIIMALSLFFENQKNKGGFI